MKRSISIILLASVLLGGWWYFHRQNSSSASGIVTLALEGNPITVDPVGVMDVHSSMVATAVHAPLAWIGQDRSFIPMVAEKMAVSADAKTLSITLSSKLRFWDSSAISPADVIYSIERYRRSANLHRWILDRVAGIQDFDDKKTDHISGITTASNGDITVSFSAPEPDAAMMLCNLGVAIVKRGSGEQPSQPFGLQVIGCGPYAPDGFEPGNFRCRLNTDDKSKPARLAFRVITDDQARLQGFRSQNVDVLRLRGPMLGEATTLSGGLLTPRAEMPNSAVSVFNANELNYLIYNWASPKLSGIAEDARKNVLAELSQRIDRSKLVSDLFPLGCAEATASIAPPSAGAPALQSLGPPAPNSPAHPPRLTLLAANDSASRQLAIAIQKQVNASGFQIETEFVDLSKLIERLIKKDFDLMLFWIELQVPSSGPYAWCSFFDKQAPLSAFGEPRDDVSQPLADARGVANFDARAEAFRKVVNLIDERQRSWVPALSRKAIVIHSTSIAVAFDVNGTPVNGLIRTQP